MYFSCNVSFALLPVFLPAVRYLGVFLAAAGVSPAIANILPWMLNNQGTDTKRGVGIALPNRVGQCGPLLGTRIFPAREAPYYTNGMAICAAFMFFNGILAALLRTYFVREDHRLERLERERGQGTEMGTGGTGNDDEPCATMVEVVSEMEGGLGYRYVL